MPPHHCCRCSSRPPIASFPVRVSLPPEPDRCRLNYLQGRGQDLRDSRGSALLILLQRYSLSRTQAVRRSDSLRFQPLSSSITLILRRKVNTHSWNLLPLQQSHQSTAVI